MSNVLLCALLVIAGTAVTRGQTVVTPTPTTATPTTLVPTIEPTRQPTIVPTSDCPWDLTNLGQGTYSKCFDDVFYTCPSCCTTDVSTHGFNCWTGGITRAECCVSAKKVSSQVDSQSKQCPYNADTSCWDEEYDCSTCCLTGKNRYGSSCWANGYTVNRCCKRVTNAPVPFGSSRPPVPLGSVLNAGSQTIWDPQFFSVANPVGPYAPLKVATVAPSNRVTQEVDATNVNSQCLYSNDASCWGGEFTCQSCCITSLGTKGTPCWNLIFTAQRCCTNTPPKSAARTFAPTLSKCPLQPASGAVDGCFTKIYTCESCCRTGRDASGMYGCWNSVYTPLACCAIGSPQNPVTVAPTTSQPTAVPTPQQFVAQEEPCKDNFDWCPTIPSAGLCGSDPQSFYSQSCPKSCSVCRTGSTRVSVSRAGPNFNSCPAGTSKIYDAQTCAAAAAAQGLFFASDNSPSTDFPGGCYVWTITNQVYLNGNFGAANKEADPLCRLDAPTQTQNAVLPISNCRDELTSCSYWAQLGLCRPGTETVQYVTQYCPLSCNLCQRRSARSDSGLSRPTYRGKVDSRGVPYDDAGQPMLPYRLVPPDWSEADAADAARAAGAAADAEASKHEAISPLSIGLICGALFVVISLIISGVIYTHRRRAAPSTSSAEMSSRHRNHESA